MYPIAVSNTEGRIAIIIRKLFALTFNPYVTCSSHGCRFVQICKPGLPAFNVSKLVMLKSLLHELLIGRLLRHAKLILEAH